MGNSCRWLHAARFAAVAIAVGVCSAGAAQTVATWANPTSGSWTDATLWSTNPVFPNNGQPDPPDIYHALIAATGSNYTIALDSDIALSALTLNSTQATLNHAAGLLSV